MPLVHMLFQDALGLYAQPQLNTLGTLLTIWNFFSLTLDMEKILHRNMFTC